MEPMKSCGAQAEIKFVGWCCDHSGLFLINILYPDFNQIIRNKPRECVMLEKLRQLLTELPSGLSLSQAQTQLQQWYRDPQKRAQGFRDDADRYAYIAARLPTTYKVVQEVFQQLPDAFHPQSLIDLGCGPGTATLAGFARWPDLAQAVLVDNDAQLLQWSQFLLGKQSATFECANLMTYQPSAADLLVLSYVLTELSASDRQNLLAKVWQACQSMLVIILPGTPRAFSILLQCRDYLLEQGAWIVAPCPHHEHCPLAETQDWCHFATSVVRPDFQKQAKKGTLGWEVEKYTYLIVSGSPTERPQGRIVRRPIKGSGHIIFDVCTQGKLVRQTVSKSQPEYAQHKKKDWGDSLSFTKNQD
jgi:ribosomal protein RSM22 (predicted rRNA methylase)